MNVFVLFIKFFVISICCTLSQISSLVESKNVGTHGEFDDEEIKYFANLSDINHFHEVLNNILIPRVVGTSNHTKIQNFITGELESLGWIVEVDEFTEKTPIFGVLSFKNIIATINPNAEKFLILACHYDSKYFETIVFVGATDSAVPCAMILNLAKVMKEEFNKFKNRADLSIQLIFFDGEEAFLEWGADDSIYGAKHLAEKWQNCFVHTVDNKVVTDLSRIDIFVLLDLIGASNPHFYSFFDNTYKWYQRLMSAESSLEKLHLLGNNSRKNQYFSKLSLPSHIEDDHIPFLARGVPILHLIPVPFPEVWHTERDDGKVIDVETVEDINRILRVFVAEYFYKGKPKDNYRSSSTYSILDSAYSNILLFVASLKSLFSLK